MTSPVVLITGAGGFIGQALCREMHARGSRVRGAVRNQRPALPEGVEIATVPHIGPATDWSGALEDVDTVIHLAARVHRMKETEVDPLAAYREVNAAGTERLARSAADSGVRRLVYVSTIKVNGPGSPVPYGETDRPDPRTPYEISKWEAERALHEIGSRGKIEIVIVRPPLVYGPGVRANFLRLMQWVDGGYPLPLARVRNLRSFVSLDNLIDFLFLCATDARASGETFMVSDGEDISTPGLILKIAAAMRRPARLFPFPTVFLRIAVALLGMKDAEERVLGSLRADTHKAESLLDWRRPESLDQGLSKTVAWYRRRNGTN